MLAGYPKLGKTFLLVDGGKVLWHINHIGMLSGHVSRVGIRQFEY
jgi:hypothetical protein